MLTPNEKMLVAALKECRTALATYGAPYMHGRPLAQWLKRIKKAIDKATEGEPAQPIECLSVAELMARKSAW